MVDLDVRYLRTGNFAVGMQTIGFVANKTPSVNTTDISQLGVHAQTRTHPCYAHLGQQHSSLPSRCAIGTFSTQIHPAALSGNKKHKPKALPQSLPYPPRGSQQTTRRPLPRKRRCRPPVLHRGAAGSARPVPACRAAPWSGRPCCASSGSGAVRNRPRRCCSPASGCARSPGRERRWRGASSSWWPLCPPRYRRDPGAVGARGGGCALGGLRAGAGEADGRAEFGYAGVAASS